MPLQNNLVISKIKKRDGRIADFDKKKIADAIYKAAVSVGGEDMGLADSLSGKVGSMLKEEGVEIAKKAMAGKKK